MEGPDLAGRKFDLVFTHHVLEHALDLEEMLDRIIGMLKPESSMLHFVPCGNPGSYEHSIASWRTDGIDRERGNRFFFEPAEHVRRLTTEELQELCRARGFQLERELYTGQHHGAIHRITGWALRDVLEFADPSRAIDDRARWKLRRARLHLTTIAALRLPARLFRRLLAKKDKRFEHYLLILLGAPVHVVSALVDRYYKARARAEWETRNQDRAGGEMILLFTAGGSRLSSAP